MKSIRSLVWWFFVLCMAAAVSAPAAAQVATQTKAQIEARLKKYEVDYYIIHSDLDAAAVREAAVRMRAMAREYHDRTRGFSGEITSKLPFYLFSRPEDYAAMGGPKGSAGVFNGSQLMARADSETASYLWHVVQHEGFHQFVHSVVRGEIPIWVNEGLADYFGEGIWTGDGMVCGVITDHRLGDVRKLIDNSMVRPFAEMITLSHAEWNKEMSARNYDQAWSMVHFLAHADNGKYQAAFMAYIKDTAAGRDNKTSFAARFGRDIDALQKLYEQWWTSLKEHPTADLETQAVVATFTSFLARAQSLKLKFADCDEFFAAAHDGKIKIDLQQGTTMWLPQTLLDKALAKAAALKTFSLVPGPQPKLKLTMPDGTEYVGSFTLRSNDNPKVEVAVTRPKAASEPQSRPAGK